MKYLYALFAFILLVFGCDNKSTIVYEYNGTKITRVDKAATSYFYYGDCDMEKCIKSYIKVEYNGFNNCMNAFLIFNNDGSVELKNAGCGSFDTSKNRSSKLFMKEYENIEYVHWHDSVKNNYNNTAFIADRIDIEKKRNEQNNSLVKARYMKPLKEK